jgi:hypothetical protein
MRQLFATPEPIPIPVAMPSNIAAGGCYKFLLLWEHLAKVALMSFFQNQLHTAPTVPDRDQYCSVKDFFSLKQGAGRPEQGEKRKLMLF